MNDTYDAIRRHAENDLETIRQRMDTGKAMDPKEADTLHGMMANITHTLNNLDDLQRRSDYRTTGIGYRTDRRTDEAFDTAMRATAFLDRIIPQLDDYDDAENRRGVPGTGPYGRPSLRRGRRGRRRAEMDYDDTEDRYNDDRYNDMEMRRQRDRRGRYMDDRYDDDTSDYTPVMPRGRNRYDDDTRNDDARYEDRNDRTRGIGPGRR